ncbi:AAA domain [Carpediemonas membranifera]|uniref:AAA domain n=1 Tax=Carpediemonas membranifera TaxID=201153 RepID=A0A8J6AQE1_9EUKA|nr:AAA domain [Carpediemonas membranifera]|eukprot:KAG9391321.1 AAA domain [Carpediemonas membranifera]
MKPMNLIFIHGPAAAGKYTIGKILSEETGIPLFHNHLVVDVAMSLFNFGEDGFNAIRATAWRVCIEEAAKAHKSLIFTFNPEATVEPSLIQDLLETYSSNGGVVTIVELKCSDDVIRERIGNESRQKFGKLTDASAFTAIKQQGGFDFPKLAKAAVTIDTEHHTPHEAARLIGEAL